MTTANPLPVPEQPGRGDLPRPHVEFPATIQLDIESRRHTRCATDRSNVAVDDTPERRPLSEFAPPAVDGHFRPQLEVDQFLWPVISAKIIETTGATLDSLAKRIQCVAEAGRSVVGVVADQPGAGCTTMTLCLARQLALDGARVALVDASFASPALGDHLGLVVDQGWENVLRGHVPLAEAVIVSQADRMALLPLACAIDPDQEPQVICSIQAAVGIGVLRDHYDVTLIDIGAMNSAANEPPASDMPICIQFAIQAGIDGILAVYPMQWPYSGSELPVEDQFIAAGIPPLGIIENFVEPASKLEFNDRK